MLLSHLKETGQRIKAEQCIPYVTAQPLNQRLQQKESGTLMEKQLCAASRELLMSTEQHDAAPGEDALLLRV